MDYIQQRILSGQYPMGHALNTKTLAAEIGISRTPIREALRRLEARGLVEIVPHLGAHVRSLQMSEFVEMCAMRQALEGYLAGAAAQLRTDTDLLQIGSALEGMRRRNREMVDFPEREAALNQSAGREDIRFHVAIMAAARNRFITREVLRLHLISRVAIGNAQVVPPPEADPVAARKARNDRRAFVVEAHAAIFQAIRDRESALARELMEKHIQEIIDQQVSDARGDVRLDPKSVLTREEEFYIATS